MDDELERSAQSLADQLTRTGLRIVFAESCTAGLVSATLAGVPGISRFHCGSAVVYRLETKATWLGVSREHLEDPGPVSSVVAREMAVGVRRMTPESHLAVSVTGHLGPNAPVPQDGLVFVGFAHDGKAGAHENGYFLQSEDRIARQREAALLVLRTACDILSEFDDRAATSP